uniref:BPTI/Kunitz inhibitor domain-containing protein n=1 Tax=Parastrongyloides trichosuri TaxID=131310 RepID=A0A0N4ZTJ1_PARTI
MKFKRNFIKIFFFVFFIIFVPTVTSQSNGTNCSGEKDYGTCKEKLQRFYYDSKWSTCLAFVYSGCGGNGNVFNTKSDCEHSCLPLDGSSCLGPNKQGKKIKEGRDCTTAQCEKGYVCARGAFTVECCEENDYNNMNAAYESKCPDGSDAGGVFKDYFRPTIGRTCDDLICDAGMKCVQINKDFAKCCGKSKKN